MTHYNISAPRSFAIFKEGRAGDAAVCVHLFFPCSADVRVMYPWEPSPFSLAPSPKGAKAGSHEMSTAITKVIRGLINLLMQLIISLSTNWMNNEGIIESGDELFLASFILVARVHLIKPSGRTILSVNLTVSQRMMCIEYKACVKVE